MAYMLAARANRIETIDEAAWKDAVVTSTRHMSRRLAFMTPAHHLIRNYAVRELPRSGGCALSIADIAASTGIPAAAARAMVADLERHLFFVVREGQDHISWAFPVTVDETPHRVTLGSGESIFGAWAEDAFATPFVQGRIRGEPVSASVRSHCAECQADLSFTVDSDFRWHIDGGARSPLVFEPSIDWERFRGATIVNDY